MEILYRPEDCGKVVLNSRGKKTKIRKYHMTGEEMTANRLKWFKDISGEDKKVIKQSGYYFFNPYRKGIYYYQIKTLFLLGCNEWHSLDTVKTKLIEILSSIEVIKNGVSMSFWELFRDRSYNTDRHKSKSAIGKVQENFVFFQRLSQLHPYGYKLRQVFSAIDIKRVSRPNFPNGVYHYRLSIYNTLEDSLPIRDFTEFEFPLHERKYINYKFIGTIITKDKVIRKGILV